ncbi:MAG: tetratricopeptide repeat protein, partial [Candidatus Bathyarchaeota archaeon]|nr:tetratricopeptide repeat protein [Candidatus Bathyarchaeota archaeon]
DIMEKLLKTGLIKEKAIRGVDVYSFVDIIVRDVVYDEVSRLRSKRLHKVVGLSLEKVYGKKIDEHFGELAYHFLESGDKGKALDYFLKAGEKAQELHAHDEAFSYLQHALELLEEQEGDLEQRVRTMETLGDLKGWIGESEACAEYWTRALTLWDQMGDKKNLARLHGKMANRYWMWAADKEKASEHHRAALEILEKEPESLELASVYEDISHMLWRTGEHVEALPWTQKAVEIAERLDDSKVLSERAHVLARCYNNLAVFSHKSGDNEKAKEYYQKGLKLSLENNFGWLAAGFYSNLSEVHFSVGEFQKSFETAEKGIGLAEKVGALGNLAWTGSVLAMYHVNMGEMQKAISMLEDVLELDKKIKFTAHLSYSMWGLGVCSYWLGEYEKSLHYLMEAYDIARKTGEYQAHGLATGWLGELHVEMNDYAQAENYFNESKTICERTGETLYQYGDVFPALSKLYLEKGEIEKAEKLIEETYRYATKTRNRLVLSYAEMLKAMLFSEQKKWKQSSQHFEKSLEEHRSLNAKKWHLPRFAELLFEYGSMLLDRSEEGDKGKAHSILHESLEIYQKMDAKEKIKKVRSRMTHLEIGRELTTEPQQVTVESPQVAVPSHVATGYGDLDDLLFGGVPRNYAVILTSPSCDERNLLIRKFLEAGAKKGQVTFHVTTKADGVETLAEEFQSNFYVFICNPQADKILKSVPNVFKLKGVDNLTDVNIALSSAFRRLSKVPEGPRRICLEIISDVLLQ